MHEFHPTWKGSARDQPIEQLNALVAGLFDEIEIGELDCPLRIVDHAVHELQVEFLVDEAGALAFKLVRETARADHQHLRIRRESGDGATDGFAQLEAATTGGQWEEHRIDADRHALHWPFLVRPHQGHGQRESVVDQHFLAGQHVEIFADQAVANMPGQIFMTWEARHGRDAPAFIGADQLRCRTDGEGRQLI